MIVLRQSPVKISTLKPAYAPNPTSSEHPPVPPTLPHEQPESQRHKPFTIKTPGFGSRHNLDDAPFSLWDGNIEEFRDPSHVEIEWIIGKYKAFAVHVDFPDIIIRTSQPPSHIPLTVACALARFIPQDLHLLSLPYGSLRPYGTKKRDDIVSYSLPKFEIPTHQQSMEVIKLLSSEVDIRAIHFMPPQIIVELDVASGRTYDKQSLPPMAGGLPILYHESIEDYWKGSSQKAYERLITPTNLIADVSDYLYNDPHELSPGVCLSSAYLSRNGSITSQWLSTSAGVLVQNGGARLMTSACHGFPTSDEVYHPSPTGRRIGQIVQRFPAWDIALVQLDPSISFSNRRYFAAPVPSRLISIEEIRAGDWFEVDGMSTGRVDLCARGRSWYNPTPTSSISLPVAYKDWRIETAFSLFGTIGAQVKEGICGAPIVDEDGRVGGLFVLVDEAGLWAHTLALDFFMHSGWSLV